MTNGYANKHGPQIYEKVYLWLVSQYYYQSACFAKSKLLCCRKHMTKSLLQIGIPNVPALRSCKEKLSTQFPVPFCKNGLLEITLSFFHGQIDPTLIVLG